MNNPQESTEFIKTKTDTQEGNASRLRERVTPRMTGLWAFVFLEVQGPEKCY